MSSAFAGLLAIALTGTAPADPPPAALVESVVRVPEHGTVLALRDLDGDGRSDLVRVDSEGFAVRYQDATGRLSESDDAGLAWPSKRLAWDLVDIDGDGAVEIAMAVDGREVRAWRPGDGGALGESELVLAAPHFLPAGVNRMGFARDVDGDGTRDLVLPGTGEYEIYMRRDGAYADPIEVGFEVETNYSMGEPSSLTSNFGQEVEIPWFSIEDVDGDDVVDLIVQHADSVSFHLARPEISAEPTWRLDLEELRDELPKTRGFDLDDILSNVARQVTWRVADLDGEAPNELILMVGSTFKLYTGGSVTGPRRTPDQALRSSGNVLYLFLRNVHGGEHPDLQIVRGERISLGRVLRWILFPGSVDLDLFTYRNEGGRFSTKPSRRSRVTFKIPRILSFLDRAKELEKSLKDQIEIPTKSFRGSLESTDGRSDVVELAGGQVEIHRGAAPPESELETREFVFGDVDAMIEDVLLNDLDALEDGGSRVIDLGAIDRWRFYRGAELRELIEKRTPDAVWPLASESTDHSVHPKDVDGDGREDLVVIAEEENEWVVQLLVWERDPSDAEEGDDR